VKIASVNASINTLEKHGDICVESSKSSSGQDRFIRKFRYVFRDEFFEAALRDFERIKQDSRMRYLNTDTIASLMLIAELKRQNGGVKDGEK